MNVYIYQGNTQIIDLSNNGEYLVTKYDLAPWGKTQPRVNETLELMFNGSDLSDSRANLNALIETINRDPSAGGSIKPVYIAVQVEVGDPIYKSRLYTAFVTGLSLDMPNRTGKITAKMNITRENFWESLETTPLPVSNNVATAWTQVEPAGGYDLAWICTALDQDGTVKLAGQSEGRIYQDTGSGWAEIQPDGDNERFWSGCAISQDGSIRVAVSTGGGDLFLYDYGVWYKISMPGMIAKDWGFVSISGDGLTILAGQSYGRAWMGTKSGGVWSWAETQPAGNVDGAWYSGKLSEDGSRAIICNNGGRVYMLIDGAWIETQPAGNANKGWSAVDMNRDGSRAIACINIGRVYFYADGVWSETRPAGDIDKNWNNVTMDENGSKALITQNGGRAYYMTGATWVEVRPAGDINKNYWGCSLSGNGEIGLLPVHNGRLYQGDTATKVSLSVAGTARGNFIEYPAQSGFDLPVPLEIHLRGTGANLNRLYVGGYDFQNLGTDFVHFYEAEGMTTTDGTVTADATASGGSKLAFSLDTADVQSAYTAFQTTIEDLRRVQGRKLRPFIRWAETTDIANVQIRLRLTMGASVNAYTTAWVTPGSYKIQELPVLQIPGIPETAGDALAPQYRIYIDLRRITVSTEDVSVDYLTLLPADNISVLDQGAGMEFDPSATEYHLIDLPYDQNALAFIYNGSNYAGTWNRLGLSPVTILPESAGSLIFNWRGDGVYNETLIIDSISYRKRRLAL